MNAPGPREEARRKGLTRFFGKICEHHPEACGERMVSNKRCVVCLKAQSKKFIKAWKRKNKDVINEQRHNDEFRAKAAAYMRTPERCNKRRARDRVRYKTDIQYAIRARLRSRLKTYLKNHGIRKTDRTFDLIGCSVGFLVKHLERQFLPGMSWDNASLWHIDHKQPIASFDLTDSEQQRACFHYSNLQPLWWHINLRVKRDKCDYQLTEADKLPPLTKWRKSWHKDLLE
jgi:hypothetical protein